LNHETVNTIHIFDDNLRRDLGLYSGIAFWFGQAQFEESGFIQLQIEDVVIEKQDCDEGLTSASSAQGFRVDAAKFFSKDR